MKVLQAIGGGDVGGAETFFVRLALALHRAGLEQRVVMRPNDAREKRLRDGGIAPVIAPFGGALDLRTSRILARQIDEFAPDAVLSWMNRATRFAAAAVRRSARRPALIARQGGYYNLKYYRGCDWIVGNTPDIVRYLADAGWPADRARFVPNFVDGDTGTAIGRTWLGVPAAAKLVLALGRLHPNKAFDVLVAALADLDGVHLLLAGDGDQARALEGLARRLEITDRVHFLGWRDDVADLMATVDALVCPSRIEPLGNVVIEAWARGLPVVAAAAAGPDWLIEDGVNGLLAPVDDAPALAAAIRRVLDAPDLASRLTVAGRAAYLADFTEDAVVERYLSLFREVAG